MLRRYVSLSAAALSLSLVLATTAGAAVLWDQSNWTTTNEGSVDLSSNSCSQISGNTKAHIANDVTFASPVIIHNVRTYETAGNVQAATQAYLWITPKTASMPTENSSVIEVAANLVPITITSETKGAVTAYVVSANNLNISLPAGSYWISLTPRHSLGIFPYSVHLVTPDPIVGDPAAVIIACTANTNWQLPLAPAQWDYSLKVEGDQPVPAIAKSWGSVRALYR